MRRHFEAAPWPTSLKVISTLGTLLLAAVAYGAYRAVPTPTGFTHAFGLGIVLVFPAILIASLLSMVTGYVAEGETLSIRRPLWSTRIPLKGLRRLWHEPAVCKGSIRIFGNGGLFSFTGLYQSRALGRYRLFATDFARAVVLVLPDRTVVLTPATPQAFIDHMRTIVPSASVGVGERGV